MLRLTWLDEWCEANSAYPVRKGPEGNWTQSLGNVSKAAWLQACVLALRYEAGFSGPAAEALRRWGGLEPWQRAVLGSLLGFGLAALLWLVASLRTFRVMSHQGMPWSRLVHSQALLQLVMDNALWLVGLGKLIQDWLFPAIVAGNQMCLARAEWRLLGATIWGTLTPTIYLGAQLMTLALSLDRIQGICWPIAYHLHDRPRRCLLINVLAYAGPFLLLLASNAYVNRRLYGSRWDHALGPGSEGPEGWEDVVCYRRLELSALCGWPDFAHAVDWDSGRILASSTEPRYWCLEAALPPGLCPVHVHFHLIQSLSIAIASCSFMLSLCITVTGSVLVTVFRRNEANKVQILNKATAEAQEEEHEKAVTVAIIAECAIAVTAAGLAMANEIYIFFRTSAGAFTMELFNSLPLKQFVIGSGQTLLGSYLITYIVFRTFRETLLEWRGLAWLPEPWGLSAIAFAYAVMLASAALPAYFLA